MNPAEEPSLLVDASVWAAAAAPGDPRREEAERLLESPRSLVALDLTAYEVANAVGVRMGQARRAERLLSLLFFRCERILRVDSIAEPAINVAVAEGLTAYDAAYVTAARRYGHPLVSFDLRDLVSKGLAVTPDAAV